MPFTPPAFQDSGHNLLLRYDLQLSMPFDPMVHRLVAEIHEERNRKLRKDVEKGAVNALSVVLGNLLRAHYHDPNLFVAVPLRNKSYPKSPFNPFRLGIRAVQKVVHYLQEAIPPYVEWVGGNNNPVSGKGYSTRLRATKRLVDELENCWRHSIAPTQPNLPKYFTGNDFAAQNQSLVNGTLFHLAELPAIRLKSETADDNSTRHLLLPDAPHVRQMERNLASYNNFLSDHWVDLLIPDEEFLALQRTSQGEPDRYFGDQGRRIELDLNFRRKLYRVFNNGTIDQGGRFYGGWWQNIPSHYRKAITINWHTTVEIDFSSMHPNMLYAMEGRQAPEDSYALEGFPTEHRPLLKTTFQKLLNATGRIQAPRKDTLPEGWTWKQIVVGLRELHEPISKHFLSGRGIELQRLDSDIAELVMIKMMNKGLLVLPVHDSFIVWDTKVGLLRAVMQEAYRERMGQEIGMKADVAWIDENIPPEVHELHEKGVYHIEDSIAAYSDGPEFTAYRQRRRDFMDWMGEEWGYRHSFPP